MFRTLKGYEPRPTNGIPDMVNALNEVEQKVDTVAVEIRVGVDDLNKTGPIAYFKILDSGADLFHTVAFGDAQALEAAVIGIGVPPERITVE